MKVVILAGGFGTRLSEYTQIIPKPMIEIGGKPILWHIMNIYSQFGYDDFIIALGYKQEVIKTYFLNYYSLNSDFEIDLTNGAITYTEKRIQKWKISLVDTGVQTMTGGRLKRLENIIGNKTFLMTYGDAVSDVDINKLLSFHKFNNKIATVTAVHPTARFGELTIDYNNLVTNFLEKPQTKGDWINGGFFVFDPRIFNYITDDMTVLEKEPLESLAKENSLVAYQHTGFWQSMDTLRDKNHLEELILGGNYPWLKN